LAASRVSPLPVVQLFDHRRRRRGLGKSIKPSMEHRSNIEVYMEQEMLPAHVAELLQPGVGLNDRSALQRERTVKKLAVEENRRHKKILTSCVPI